MERVHDDLVDQYGADCVEHDEHAGVGQGVRLGGGGVGFEVVEEKAQHDRGDHFDDEIERRDENAQVEVFRPERLDQHAQEAGPLGELLRQH